MYDVAGTALDYALLYLSRWWPLLAIVVLAMVLPPLRRISFQPRAIVAIPIIAAVSLSMSVALAIASGIPDPLIHDDYGCLLGGQIYASGYSACPTPPHWQHFETLHVLLVPSYASKYPVGQQLVLALGIRLFGIALAGSWLAAAAGCVAIWWALRAVLTPGWAFAGGLIAALHPLMLNWSSSYRGGALGAVGGALLIGALLRLAARPSSGLRPPSPRTRGEGQRCAHAFIAGTGIALLAITRPYEGVVLTIACALVFFRQWRLAIYAAIPVLIGLAGVAAHNRAVTGSATTLPWVEYARQYEPISPFVWGGPSPRTTYRHEELRHVFQAMYTRQRDRVITRQGFIDETDRKLFHLRTMLTDDPENRREALLWPLFFIPFVMLPRALREDKHVRAAVLVLVLFLFAPLSVWFPILTHYMAPVAAVVATLWMLLARRLALHERARWLLVAMAIVFVINSIDAWRWWSHRTDGPEPQRRALVAAAGAGKHLFVVAQDVFGVVANEADIASARVIWARDLGDNAALRAHFRDRQQWKVEKGERGLRLVRLQ